MIKKEEKSIALISFSAVLAIIFMLVISGLQLSEVPSLVGQAIKAKTASLKTTCSETDDGDYTSTKGVTSLKRGGTVTESKEDYCADEEAQVEYYCENDKIVEDTSECVCEDGACTAYKKAETEPEITIATDSVIITQQKSYKKESEITKVDVGASVLNAAGCLDSDGGKTYGEAGTATSTSDSGSDACRTNGKLVEYYCDSNDEVQSEDVSCASGEVCHSGACITEGVCTDSESTFNLYAAGRVVGTWYGTTTSGEWTDKCDSYSGKVFEYYCNDAGYAYYYMKECPSGDTCTEGLCADLCVDTDEVGTNNGIDYYTVGTATGTWYLTGEESSWTDSCSGSGQIVENYCFRNYVYKQEKSCPSGYTCSNGACARTT